MNVFSSQTPTLAGDQTPPSSGRTTSDATPDSSRTSISPDPDPEKAASHGAATTTEPKNHEDEKPPATTTAVLADDNIVGWDGPDDPECPRNWPTWHKILFVAVTSSMMVCVSFGSSVFAPAEAVFARAYGVPLVVGQLGVALWILGFAAGPLFFGPASELAGHLAPLAVAFSGMAALQLPIALVRGSAAAVLACRFLAGASGAGVFAVVSGTYVELFEPVARGVALGCSGMCITLGAVLAPIVGAYVTYGPHGDGKGGSWRWTAWVTLIMAAALGLAGLFVVRETSTRTLLRRKAARLRRATGNGALHARSEETPVDWRDVGRRYLTKPVRLILVEPILVILTAYLTLVYGILYLAFQAFPRAFEARGWSVEQSQLPFVAVLLGIVSAFLTCSLYTVTVLKRRLRASNGVFVPEWRLPPMMLGAVVLPPSLFWFGWSGGVHWICQVLASYMIGYGLLLIFITGIVYIVDVYQSHSNSAMSIHIIIRSLVASSFPLWSNIMYNRLGIAWGTSLLAFLCLAMLFAPMVFYWYGARIRSWSKFSVSSTV